MVTFAAPQASGRSPYGERGLKSENVRQLAGDRQSLSLRRAWIEITRLLATATAPACRSPYGERGLKCILGGLVRRANLVALLTESVD